MTINKTQTSKQYDLEERTLKFSQRAIKLCKKIPKNSINYTLINQLTRSATSVGANYTEANDALGKKDFLHRLRIARKEAKETIYWLKLTKTSNPKLNNHINPLIKECTELRNILSAIINKSV